VTNDRPQHEDQLAQLFGELDIKEQREPPPEIMPSSPLVDAFAWRGPLHATKTRRAAILLWASGYTVTGLSFLALAVRLRFPLLALFGAVSLLAGIRITLNACARNKSDAA
jgi:hypothetical protein